MGALQWPAPHGAVEAGVAVVEDAAVPGHHPVAAAVMGGGHPDHGLVEDVPAHRAGEAGVAVAEDAPVGRHQVVAVARDGAQRHGLGPVGAGDLQRGAEGAEGRGREGQCQVACGAGRQVAVGAAELEDPPAADEGDGDVHALAGGPELQGGGLRLAGQDRVVDAVGEHADREQRDFLGPREVGGLRRVAAHEELGGRGAVADPHQGGRGVVTQDDVAVAPAPAPARDRAGRVGAARPVVVHPHGQGHAHRRRGGVSRATPVAVGREAWICVGVGAGLGVGVQVGRQPDDRGKATVDPLEVGQDEELLGRC